MATFIRVYDTRTNEKVEHEVPEHFTRLFSYLAKTPKQASSEDKSTTTTTQKKER